MFQIGMQLGVMSILTLVTVVALTHIATMLLFRRLVIGGETARVEDKTTPSHPKIGTCEDFFVPVRSTLGDAADEERRGRLATISRRIWSTANDLPNSLREGLIRNSGVSREVYVRCYHRKPDGHLLLLCNPSGETVDSLCEKAVSLSEDIGFDSLAMFDYRPTGRSCKGLVAPDTTTMLEDAESVIQWLITVKGVEPSKIALAGISLGGLQAMRLALKYPETSKLILINTFASFSCLLRSSASLLPGALRIGGTSAFLPDITRELRTLSTPVVAVVSVAEDERIPSQCTDEMLSALREGSARRVLHMVLEGSHSDPKVDHNSLETIRDFLRIKSLRSEEV